MAWVEEHEWSLRDLNAHNYGHLLQFANYGYLQAGMLAEAAEIRARVRSDFIASGLASEIEAPCLSHCHTCARQISAVAASSMRL